MEWHKETDAEGFTVWRGKRDDETLEIHKSHRTTGGYRVNLFMSGVGLRSVVAELCDTEEEADELVNKLKENFTKYIVAEEL